MKNVIVFCLLLLLLTIGFVSPVSAQIDAVGTIDPPPGTEQYITASGLTNPGDIAIVFFISRMIRLVMIIAGVWATIMLLMASYTFITSSGDSGIYQKVRNQITNAAVGLLVIMISFTITGLISLVLFGDAGFILNPVITGP